MSQCDEILRHMRKVGPINGAEAFRLYGCMRPPARVSDLRRMGYPVRSRRVKVRNRRGEAVSVSEYYMEGEE